VRILIVRLGSLGDIVHALPAAAALRQHFRDAQIDWLVEARHASVLELVPIIDRRVIVNRGSQASAGDAGPTPGVVETIRHLRTRGYDIAVDLQGLIKSALFARLSGARRVVGFDRRSLREPLAAVFYSETYAVGASHVVDKNLGLVSALGIESTLRRFPIDVPASPAAVAVQQDLGRVGSYAMINPGAAWPNKRWPAGRFGAVAAWLRERHALPSVVVWGAGERDLAERVSEASGGAARIAPPTGIGDLLAIAQGARLVVSGDTGPLHLAAAVGAPIVGLFGPTDPMRNGPWDAADISLSRFHVCGCHYRRRCRRRRPCLEDISIGDVQGAVDRRLAAGGHV
jgi:lipopolysaccharide heptosyltransferase I